VRVNIAGLPDPPACAFASDNAAGAHPLVIEAITSANQGHVLAYGQDRYTAQVETAFCELFDAEVTTLLTTTGTGANVLALAATIGPAEAVVCTRWSHIAVDETGAPERALGAKLMDLESEDAKLRPEQIDEVAGLLGVQHHAQPGVISITQSTELGTLYSVEEIAALCDRAHAHGMRVHLDGARLANAVAAAVTSTNASPGQVLRSMTIDAGVDVVTFGGTKNGLLGAEAVVILNPALGRSAPYLRKQVTQLSSKMRFLSAQFLAILQDDLWVSLASSANAMTERLARAVIGLEGVEIDHSPVVNSLFPRLRPEAIEPLREWCFFWDWDPSRHQVRWMTAWDTTEADVDRFAEGLSIILAACN